MAISVPVLAVLDSLKQVSKALEKVCAHRTGEKELRNG